MKQRGDDYGSTLSLLNEQNGHLLLPLTCVLSILYLKILRINFRLFLGHHFVGRWSLKNDPFNFLIEPSERHTATDLVHFVYSLSDRFPLIKHTSSGI